MTGFVLKNQLFLISMLMHLCFEGNLAASGCPGNMVITDGYVFISSNDQTDADSAERDCAASGGHLAKVDDEQIKSEILRNLEKQYTSNLEKVKIYQNPNNDNLLKYRPTSIRFNDKTKRLWSWTRPISAGELSSIKLYKRSSNSRQVVRFCWFDGRDTIRSRCNKGWSENFLLYGSSQRPPNSVEVYNYIRNKKGQYTSRLSLDQLNIANYKLSGSISAFYIPNISVFIGARSDVNQTKWFWNDGTMINDPNYPTSNVNVCQQMSWPLTYNDNKNLQPKLCNESQAYYICQYKPAISAELLYLPSNGSSLKLLWRAKFFEKYRSYFNPNVKIEVIGKTRTLQVNYDEAFYVIKNLSQKTNYSAKVTITSTKCPSFTATTTVTGTTGYGLPDVVKGAQANNSTMNCWVEWQHDTTDSNVTSYQITVIKMINGSEVNSNETNASFPNGNETERKHKINLTSITVDISKDKITSRNAMAIIREAIDLSNYEFNVKVRFVIAAISFEGYGPSTDVSGYCIAPLPPSPANLIGLSKSILGSLIGVVAACFILLLILLIVCICKRRVTSNKKLTKAAEHENCNNTEGDIHLITVTPSNDVIDCFQDKASKIESPKKPSKILYENVVFPQAVVKANNIEENYFLECSTKFENFKKQFEEIERFSKTFKFACKVSKEEKVKNRFKNIYPYDHSRVKLKGSNYINAAYIAGNKDRKKFIATQGPKQSTIADFWEMIWNESCSVIIMLCKCVENGKSKCERYWPSDEEPMEVGYFTVKLHQQFDYGDTTKRVIVASSLEEEETRFITQFHFVSWPDHDVPPTSSGMMYLRKVVNETCSKISLQGPIVVHCSAGAGRTGTYIAVDNLIEEMKEHGEADVAGAIIKMRRNRTNMVQNVEQYIFIHKLLVEDKILPNTEIDVRDFSFCIHQVNWDNKVLQEYDMFSRLSLLNLSDTTEENPYQNEPNSTTSNSVNQVKICPHDSQEIIRMNAHFITSSYLPQSLIVSAEPKPDQGSLFWKLIEFHEIKIIVALENEIDSVFGCLNSENVPENFAGDGTHRNSYTQKKLAIPDKEGTKMSTEVTYIHFHNWTDVLAPPSAESICEVMKKIKSSMEIHSNSKALIYCRDGCTRTGYFLAVANILEQINSRNAIDVFRTVKDLKDMRHGMVNSLDLYKLIHVKIDEYIKEISRNNEYDYVTIE